MKIRACYFVAYLRVATFHFVVKFPCTFNKDKRTHIKPSILFSFTILPLAWISWPPRLMLPPRFCACFSNGAAVYSLSSVFCCYYSVLHLTGGLGGSAPPYCCCTVFFLSLSSVRCRCCGVRPPPIMLCVEKVMRVFPSVIYCSYAEVMGLSSIHSLSSDYKRDWCLSLMLMNSNFFGKHQIHVSVMINFSITLQKSLFK